MNNTAISVWETVMADCVRCQLPKLSERRVRVQVICIYICGHAYGWGPIGWLYPV